MASRLGPGAPPSVRSLENDTCSGQKEYSRQAELSIFVCTQAPKSAEAVEQEQEAKLKARYGNLGAKKKLMPKARCCCQEQACSLAVQFKIKTVTVS